MTEEPSHSSKYYYSLLRCGWRYRSLLETYIVDNDYWSWQEARTSRDEAIKLKSFIQEFLDGCRDNLPLMKLNRWLGYIQGSLIQWRITSVEAERNWTRPLFKNLDFG